jgi:Uma2 family endonuclease
MTAEQLLDLHSPDERVELVKGVLVVCEPPGPTHGRVVANLAAQLVVYVQQAGMGQVYAGDTGFTLARNPDTVRAPDLAFVRRERLPDPEPEGFPDLAPDLAVEIWSPRDRPGKVLAKVADYLAAGTRLVWVIHPQRREARVYRADGSESLVTADGMLDGEDVLPGFGCVLETIL